MVTCLKKSAQEHACSGHSSKSFYDSKLPKTFAISASLRDIIYTKRKKTYTVTALHSDYLKCV